MKILYLFVFSSFLFNSLASGDFIFEDAYQEFIKQNLSKYTDTRTTLTERQKQLYFSKPWNFNQVPDPIGGESSGLHSGYERPFFCGRYDCPKYKLDEGFPTFQKRKYKKFDFVVAFHAVRMHKLSSSTQKQIRDTLYPDELKPQFRNSHEFWKKHSRHHHKKDHNDEINAIFANLFEDAMFYFSGKNAINEYYRLNVPFSSYYRLYKKYVIFAANIPVLLSGNLPKPTAPNVLLGKATKNIVYVKQFSGRIVNNDMLAYILHGFFHELNSTVGPNFDRKQWCYSQYNAPWVTMNRHNEIIVASKENSDILE